MSLRVFLGISFALMVVLPTWAAAAEPKTNQSSLASDRQAAPSRSARKEAADDDKKTAGKARAQKDDDDDKKAARKARAQKDDDDDKKAAGKARAQKDDDDDDKKAARKARAQKDDDDDKKAARKARAQKDDDDDDKKAVRKMRAQKDDDDDDKKATRKARAQKDDDNDKKTAGKARAQKDDDDKKAAGKARAQKDDDADKKSAGKGQAKKEATRDGQPEARRAASEPSSDNEALAALKQQLRDLRKQVSDRERLRAELAAVKAQLQGSVRTAAEPSSDNETLPALKQQLRDLRKQLGDMERLRVELATIKEQLRGSAPKPAIWGGVPLTVPRSRSEPPSGSAVIAALALPIPDVRDVDPGPLKPPVNPATDSLPAVIREQLQGTLPPKSAVEEAKAYLVKTATPGYTMTRQGVSLAIDRLHPGFAVKLAAAVKRARDEGLIKAGVFSAYRPPAFGIGAFSDKFDSLHSYGLATDITGIGGAGSASAHRWHQIVLDVGLYLPYGPDHRVEFNHTQFIPAKVAPRVLRGTITAEGPIDLRRMWLASGVDAYITEPQAVAVAGGPDTSSSADAGSDEPKPAAPMRSE
jgi:hypothetical protein